MEFHLSYLLNRISRALLKSQDIHMHNLLRSLAIHMPVVEQKHTQRPVVETALIQRLCFCRYTET